MNYPSRLRAGLVSLVGAGLFLGCASSSPTQQRLEGLEAKVDSLSQMMAVIATDVSKLDSMEKNLYAVKLLTDYLGGKIVAASRDGAEKGNLKEQAAVEIPIGESFSQGPENALLTLVEFGDLECPYCAQSTIVLDSLAKAYPKDVRLVFKHFPLEFHPQAKPAAAAAIAAGLQGKFFEFRKILVSTKKSYTSETYVSIARDLGLDEARFKREMVLDSEKKKILEKDIALGAKLGVEGTPTIFLNGKRAEQRSFRYFESILKQLKS